MNHTNLRGLPKPVVDAVSNHEFQHIPGAIQARRLMDSPQITYLKKLHKIDTDISSMLWSLIRRGMLRIIEQNSPTASVYRAAQAVFKSMNKQLGIMKSANINDPLIADYLKAMDVMDQHVKTYANIIQDEWLINYTLPAPVKTHMRQEQEEGLVDTVPVEENIFDTIDLFNKTTGELFILELCPVTWPYKAQMKKRWETEASIKAWIMEINGFKVDKASVLMIFKDYNDRRRETAAQYPSGPSISLPLRLFDPVQVAEVLRERVRSHKKAETTGVYECSPEERWKTADEWHVIDPTVKIKTCVSKGHASAEAANTWMKDNYWRTRNCVAVFVPGESTRCEKNCPVSSVCPQWKKEQEDIEARKRQPVFPKLPEHLIKDEEREFKKNRPDFE